MLPVKHSGSARNEFDDSTGGRKNTAGEENPQSESTNRHETGSGRHQDKAGTTNLGVGSHVWQLCSLAPPLAVIVS